MKRAGFTRDVLLNGHRQMRNGMIASLPDAAFAELTARVGGILDLTPRPTACAFGMLVHSPDVVRTHPCPKCRREALMSRMTICDICGGHGFLMEL